MSHAAACLFTCSGPEGQRPRRGVSSGQTRTLVGSLVRGGQSKLPGAWENLRDSHPEEAKIRVSALPPIKTCSGRHCWDCPVWRGTGAGR